jgi:hypothetical protein
MRLYLFGLLLVSLLVLAGCGGGASIPAKCAGLTGNCKALIETVCGCGALSANAEETCNNQCNAIVDEEKSDASCASSVNYWKSNFGC